MGILLMNLWSCLADPYGPLPSPALRGAQKHAQDVRELAQDGSLILNFGPNTALVDAVLQVQGVPTTYLPVSGISRMPLVSSKEEYFLKVLPKPKEGQGRVIVNRVLHMGEVMEDLGEIMIQTLERLGWEEVHFYFVGMDTSAFYTARKHLDSQTIKVRTTFDDEGGRYARLATEMRDNRFVKLHGGRVHAPEPIKLNPSELITKVAKELGIEPVEHLARNLCD